MRSIEKNFEAQASAPVEARMIAVAAGAGPRGGPSGALPHFAFEIVLDEQSALTCFSAQFHKAHPQGPASFSLRLEQARPRPTSPDLARPRPTSPDLARSALPSAPRRRLISSRPRPSARAPSCASTA